MPKKRNKISDDYRRLKNTILRKSALLFLAATIAIFIFYRLFLYQRFADYVVGFMNIIFHDYEKAYSFYGQFFRNYMEQYFFMSIALVFIVILRLYLNSFTKYFNEISKGVDALIEENAEDAAFSPELAKMEQKINSIKHTLATRKRNAELAEQRKNDLIVYLAHDLKTPLTSVIGYLTLLRDEPDLSQEMRCRYTGVALEKAEHLEELINEFFDITRFNLTTLTLESELTNLSRMLEQITYEFNPILEEKGLSWHLEIAPGVELLADPGKLERVFDNLIRNAVNYSYSGTKITLLLQRQADAAQIIVRNYGETIPPDKLEHIFDQFFRVDASRTSETGGAGLGLAIAKEIVELHHGSIEASSEQNTIEFRVTLPTS